MKRSVVELSCVELVATTWRLELTWADAPKLASAMRRRRALWLCSCGQHRTRPRELVRRWAGLSMVQL